VCSRRVRKVAAEKDYGFVMSIRSLAWNSATPIVRISVKLRIYRFCHAYTFARMEQCDSKRTDFNETSYL
jgi:hypothetical protein